MKCMGEGGLPPGSRVLDRLSDVTVAVSNGGGPAAYGFQPSTVPVEFGGPEVFIKGRIVHVFHRRVCA